MEPILWTGTTLAALSIVGKTPVDNEILNISGKWLKKPFLGSFDILVGMLFGSLDFFELREDIILCISYLLVGLRKKELWLALFRKSEKCLLE